MSQTVHTTQTRRSAARPSLSKASFDDFIQQGYTHVPLFRQVLADLDTPLSTFAKVANKPHSFLLESVTGGEQWGRYSIIGLPASVVLSVHGHEVVIKEKGHVQLKQQVEDPLGFITEYLKQVKVPEVPQLPRYAGGLVGYLGYESVQYIEPSLSLLDKPDELGIPDILLMAANEQIIFDTLKNSLYIVVLANGTVEQGFEQACERLDAIEYSLSRSAPARQLLDDAAANKENSSCDSPSDHQVTFSLSQSQFHQLIDTVKGYTLSGDTMQVVGSQRMSVPLRSSALDVYRALRHLNPSPYLYYLDLGDFYIAGSSPEILVQVKDDQAVVRPLAGTRPRGKTDAEDAKLAQELLQDEKELAEHLMLIDLARNDLGRIAQPGTVTVDQQMAIERYSHVMHIVSNVTAKIKAGCTGMDVFRATFPAGTLSGAPKVRAMEIIAELEPCKRGVYGGAVGYLGWSGSVDVAIAIRTAVIKDDTVYIQAGAGLVADSVHEAEWQETLNKGRAVIRAVELAGQGLQLD